MSVNTRDVDIPHDLYERALDFQSEAVIECLQIIENYIYFHVPAMYRLDETLDILSIARQLLDNEV